MCFPNLNRSKPDYGFTLIELLLALSIGGAVLGSMITLFASHVRSSRLASIRIEAIQRARFASDLLHRELSLAGSGMPNAQPMIVYAGPADIVLSADLTSSTPGDRVALYTLPNAPLAETLGVDSAALVLPNAQLYPDRWYGGTGTPGPAETIQFSFAQQSDGDYALVRSVNGLEADTLLRGLQPVNATEFLRYEVMDRKGLRSIGSGPIWHYAPIHESPGDTGTSALTDSIKLVLVSFKLRTQDRRATKDLWREFAIAVSLRNAGLVRNASCGEAPRLAVAFTAVPLEEPLRVELTWPPALDERDGEADVYQYTLYRRRLTEAIPRPIAAIPPDAAKSEYRYTDTDVVAGETYVYSLGATDCTPMQSTLVQSAQVTVSEDD